MLQVIQNIKSGITSSLNCPVPETGRGKVLIASRASLISAGTEKMLVEFGRSGWLDKARSQPDKVKQVIEKIRTDGLSATMSSVQAKLDQPVPLGYSNAGVVLETGSGVHSFAPGDRVVSNGPHAEVVAVPQNLCVRIPAGVSDSHGSFAVVASIAMQGIRLAQPALGECVVVTGLGLVGLLTVQMLCAQGCRVLGIDFDKRKLELAAQYGAEVVDLGRGEDPVSAASSFSRGRGVDAVLITASTKSSEPVHQAALMCRKRGRIVLVGVSGLELLRDDFYQKELSFQVSCSYGPGRYDPAYESGQDYPFGLVRWTAQRNIEAVLDLIDAGKLDVESLITHRFPIAKAADAYELFFSDEQYLGIVLEYPNDATADSYSRSIQLQEPAGSASEPAVGLIGAGNYASGMLLPGIVKTGARLRSIADSGGVKAAHQGRKHGFETAVSESSSVLNDPVVNAVLIATRHDSHAALTCKALRAGKHVFVEKPLCLTLSELQEIEEIYRSLGTAAPLLMVDFNRRFAPQVIKMKQLISTARSPKAMVMTVNAGAIPTDHWTRSSDVGGGRIAGEGCHFIDLLRHLAGCPMVSLHTVKAPPDGGSIVISFEDGSTGTVHYLSGGHKSYPKERLSVFCDGKVLELNNFIRLRGWGFSGFKKMNLWRQDKGNHSSIAAFIDAIRKGMPAPIPFQEIQEVARFTIEAANQ